MPPLTGPWGAKPFPPASPDSSTFNLTFHPVVAHHPPVQPYLRNRRLYSSCSSLHLTSTPSPLLAFVVAIAVTRFIATTSTMSQNRFFSTKPSPYPRAIFHTIRACQVVSSLIVTGVLGYFIYWLQVDSWYIPWTFILVSSQDRIANSGMILMCTTSCSLYPHSRTPLSSSQHTFITFDFSNPISVSISMDS